MVAHRKTDPLKQLPANVVPMVLRQVSTPDWPFLRLVSKFWKEAVDCEITILRPLNWNLSIARKFPKLRRLDLKDSFDKVEVEDILHILSQLPELHAVVNWKMPPISYLGSMYLQSSRFAQLDEIGLAHCPNIRDLRFLKHIPNLKTLRLDGCRFRRHEIVEGFQNLGFLTSLKISDSVLVMADMYDFLPWDDLFKPLSTKHLKVLAILHEDPVFVSYATMATFTSLTGLDISFNRYGNEGVEVLNALTNLTSLHIAKTLISSTGVGKLTALTRLQSLDARNPETRFYEVGGSHALENFPGLRRLCIAGPDLTSIRANGGFSQLHQLTCLRVTDRLILSRIRRFHNFYELHGLTQLLELHAHSSNFEDYSLQPFTGLVSLRSLLLSCSSTSTVTDAGIACLSVLKGLEELSLYGFPDTTDYSFRWLRTLSKLTKLDLKRCVQATIAGLRRLEYLPLEWLRCQRSDVLEKDLKALPPKLQLAYWRGHRGYCSR